MENHNTTGTKVSGQNSIGILGAGHIAQAVARHAAKAGYEVTISSRRAPAELTGLASSLGERVKTGTLAEAAASDLVLIAVPFDQVQAAARGIDWAGRIVIDTTNAIVFPQFKPADLGGRTSSKVNAEFFPGASLIKAFNTLPAAILASDPESDGGRRVIFVAGDEEVPKKQVINFAKKLGFSALDLGKIDEGGRLQEFGGSLISKNLIRLDL
ncbi:NADPH-dependent F420 reductase [Mucilaginibacter terrae]|uniref:Dinucleotide-binding enzyme n=1 Tax=Mucilaginibacter terrae TaxID=1955052 RepID=A0ABU3GNI3_9SPHI|nr:NADPH-dependent F420 reductase [Mucilaginibacter terrae]MDT3401307.1 putative dinucleotide-binding enzyme [Mucilaginibacter terrae]